MVSFIIIGRNIQSTIELCLNSVYKAVDENKIIVFEIMYVDSNSSDNTLNILTQFPEVKVEVLKHSYNAAIARNVGARRSKGYNLFFLDGDMELHSNFVNIILDEKKDLKYNFVSGDLVNYYYDQSWQPTGRVDPYFGKTLTEDQYSSSCGGIFAIKREYWEGVEGMRTYYRRSQDIDLAFRLAQKGILLLRKKETVVNHHTISYYDNSRFKSMLLKGDFLYNGLIARQHFFNKYAIKRNITNNSSAIILITSLLLVPFIGLWSIGFYLLSITLRSIFRKAKEGIAIYKWIIINIAIDVQTCYGFLFFYPKSYE